MQKWEYMIVKGLTTDSGYVLTNVNDEYVAKPKGFKVEGQNLVEYLNQMGQNGWEVAGFSAEAMSLRFLLKRPID